MLQVGLQLTSEKTTAANPFQIETKAQGKQKDNNKTTQNGGL
jgi:hypothetical protein